MSKRAIVVLTLVVAVLAVPLGARLVHGQRGNMVGTVVIKVVDQTGTPLPGACFSVGYVGEDPAPTYCDGDDRDTDPRDGVIGIERQPTDNVVREELPPPGYRQEDPSSPYTVTVPLHDVVILTRVYVATGEADDEAGDEPTVEAARVELASGGDEPSGTDDAATLRQDVFRLTQEVARLESRLIELEQRALPPRDPNARSEWWHDYKVDPDAPSTFRLACNIRFVDQGAGPHQLECSRLP